MFYVMYSGGIPVSASSAVEWPQTCSVYVVFVLLCIISHLVCCFVLLNQYWGIVTVPGFPLVGQTSDNLGGLQFFCFNNLILGIVTVPGFPRVNTPQTTTPLTM